MKVESLASLFGYSLFIRWCGGFNSSNITTHPEHERAIQLSPLLSGYFAFQLTDKGVALGVQALESVWLESMRLSCAYLTPHRLTLCFGGINDETVKVKPICVGIYLTSMKHAEIRDHLLWVGKSALVEIVRVPVDDNIITPIDGEEIADASIAVDDSGVEMLKKIEPREKTHLIADAHGEIKEVKDTRRYHI